MEAYQHYTWPGNVRELRNVLERAVLFSDGGGISTSFLPEQLGRVNDGRHVSNPLGQMNHFNSHTDLGHANQTAHSGNGKMTDGLRFIDFRHKEQPDHEEQSEGSSYNGIVLPIGSTLEKAEQLLIEKTLAHVGNNKSEAARILGCSRKTLHNKLARSG
jgi:DNA-binding NtrC family response regulator